MGENIPNKLFQLFIAEYQITPKHVVVENSNDFLFLSIVWVKISVRAGLGCPSAACGLIWWPSHGCIQYVAGLEGQRSFAYIWHLLQYEGSLHTMSHHSVLRECLYFVAVVLPKHDVESSRNCLRARQGIGTVSLLPHSVSQSKSQGQPGFQVKGIRLHFCRQMHL